MPKRSRRIAWEIQSWRLKHLFQNLFQRPATRERITIGVETKHTTPLGGVCFKPRILAFDPGASTIRGQPHGPGY
jgi:hypothetical protein